MKLNEFLAVITKPDLIRIIKNGQQVYIGYLGCLEHTEEMAITGEETVTQFRAVPEIKHRRYKELGLIQPLQPEQTPQYSFSDLQMSLYYTIYINEREETKE